jgi:hypothetical protein
MARFLTANKKERNQQTKKRTTEIRSSASERHCKTDRVEESTVMFGLYVSAMRTSELPV